MSKQEIIVVIHSNYAEGRDAYAFWDKKTAQKSVDADVKTEVKNLTEEGRVPVTLYNLNNVTVYVPDTDIYYEWEIINTTIE